MKFDRLFFTTLGLLTAVSLASCKNNTPSSTPTAAGPASSPAPTTTTGNAPSTSATAGASPQVEKAKPAPGKGNVQGKVLYNSKPVANIEVKLCEDFSQFIGGCSGKTYTAHTDKNGEYLIANVPPKTYKGLLAKVFDTDSYVFMTTGFGINSNTYEVAPDKTLFVNPTNLFKGDLKVLNPKAGSKVSATNLELKWKPYPDAAYYKFSLYAEDMKVTSPYINERAESPSFKLDKPMPKGTYRYEVEAYNDSDVKLAEDSKDIKFAVTGP